MESCEAAEEMRPTDWRDVAWWELKERESWSAEWRMLAISLVVEGCGGACCCCCCCWGWPKVEAPVVKELANDIEWRVQTREGKLKKGAKLKQRLFSHRSRKGDGQK